MRLRLNDSMSVSIPCASIAAVFQLSLLEALLIALAETVPQSLHKRGTKPAAFQMLFTVGGFR